MNVLAHALLAGPDAGLRIGGLLGDFVHGTPDPSLPEGIRRGIRLHRAIDSFTDRHDEVRAAREHIPPPFRRYAGILLDMWFDHCLARDFARWSDQPLEIFSTTFREDLHAATPILPASLLRFLGYMDRNDLPAAYVRADAIERALQGLSSRLTRANPVGESLPLLQANDDVLRGHFGRFFPELKAFSESWIEQHATDPT
ncbi:acyl carrier protein phosphodiesterase [Luteibacter rhizovicinus]|uniref:Acyl carrier protein phosphodiesterase n=1 Tax=Luteibacter rhizovicinus TaxID=242606 RepID=A0A4R3YJD7_9GAMM|nr:ACP phosphodiesterase [Luteibacter rhizovicinus]TCV92346.1 acyl carrier protein phosphodiesterase [Luteibacter rhizovicinus]